LPKHMPKLIDYPRTSYAGAWELAEVVDDTGGKCAIDTAAKKLNRKVSGSFKAIIGSAVKFGLMTSKRELLSTTTLFKRIKHAYDKKEEILFHREAFLTPPLFMQLCRKFRSRELPVQMLDVMLIREFGVEEINAQGVAKAFVEGCRMVGLLDERNIVADIDALSAQQPIRKELASPTPAINTNRPTQLFSPPTEAHSDDTQSGLNSLPLPFAGHSTPPVPVPEQPAASVRTTGTTPDVVASLFGLLPPVQKAASDGHPARESDEDKPDGIATPSTDGSATSYSENYSQTGPTSDRRPQQTEAAAVYQLQVSGPGVNTSLSINEEEDIAIALALLEKIRRQLRTRA
jgi:hypothetical protein